MNELLKSLACSGSECLCWILVLFNIFAVFFLVFCSFWKVSRLAKIGGWVYSGVLVCLTILILFFHTCIYTLLATIFTGMMLMAILSVILPQQGEPREKTEKEKAPKPMGAYLISETFDGWFVFGLYDSKRRKLVRSTYAYSSVEAAKEAIASCRENGKNAETEDRSGTWLQEKYVPKYEIRRYGEYFGFALYVFEEDSIIHSEMFNKIGRCLSRLAKVRENVSTADIYMSVDKVSGNDYKRWGWIEEEPVVEEPVIEEPVIEEPVVEEPAPAKKCIVVWADGKTSDRVFRYKVVGSNPDEDNTVVIPVSRPVVTEAIVGESRVLNVEYYKDAAAGDTTAGGAVGQPKKAVISIQKKSGS